MDEEVPFKNPNSSKKNNTTRYKKFKPIKRQGCRGNRL